MPSLLIKLTSTAIDCDRNGHCPHEGTAIGLVYCCRCGQYLYAITQKLNFYEETYHSGTNGIRSIYEWQG